MKNPTEEVRRICLDTLVVGDFAYAQYDVFFLFSVILNDSEESHRRSAAYKSWDISLTLNMT